MEVGQVGFNHPDRVRTYLVKEKNKDILKALNKTKVESYPDLEGTLQNNRNKVIMQKPTIFGSLFRGTSSA
jgi:hypothetical protein